MRFRTLFVKDNGYRLYRDEISVMLAHIAPGARLPDEMQIQSTRSFEAFVDSVRQREPLPTGPSRIVQKHEIGPPAGDVLYKYVPESTWKYMEAGLFQLGSCDYYRAIENESARDVREGECVVALQNGDDQVSIGVRAGFNCGIFCGTHQPSVAMKAKFGGKLIRIEPLGEFAEALRIRLRGKRAFVRNVIYTNDKTVAVADATATKLREDLRKMEGVLNIEAININYFELLYELGLGATLFVKPAHYAHESERRIVIEKKNDLVTPTMRFMERSLLQYITVLE